VSAGGDRLRLVADLSARVGRCDDLDHVITACLEGLDELFGYEHSILLVLDDASGRLFTVASHGYEEAGIGSEVGVGVGQGFLGLAAVERRSVRIGALARMVQYGRTAQREYAAESGASIPDVMLPGLPNVQSQLAAPVLRTGELLGVVAVESARGAAFGPEDEAVLEVVAQMLAGAIEAERLSSDAPGAVSDGRAAPEVTPTAGAPAVVRFYPADGSTFLDGEYLVKGVPGRILRKLLQEWREEGRTEFTNREVRLDPALELPPFKDNFESRLILLKRRLEERSAPVRIEATGRGRFALLVSSPIELDVREDTPARDG
jgi:adenylate cyclase